MSDEQVHRLLGAEISAWTSKSIAEIRALGDYYDERFEVQIGDALYVIRSFIGERTAKYIKFVLEVSGPGVYRFEPVGEDGAPPFNGMVAAEVKFFLKKPKRPPTATES
ncbi:hypothetical protein GF420_09375 [candidate division GN15 bacterium]|nr:hypothetical protein [candidate division GN15 bacterium]